MLGGKTESNLSCIPILDRNTSLESSSGQDMFTNYSIHLLSTMKSTEHVDESISVTTNIEFTATTVDANLDNLRLSLDFEYRSFHCNVYKVFCLRRFNRFNRFRRPLMGGVFQ